MIELNKPFAWGIDNEYFVWCSIAKKTKLKDFVESVAKTLNEYVAQSRSWLDVMGASNNHPIDNLNRLPNKEAKSLYRHFIKINEHYQSIMTNEIEIFQIKIKHKTFKAFRCFGYVLNNTFYLIKLDPNHEIYKAS